MKKAYLIGIAVLLILSLVSGAAYAEGTTFVDKKTKATFVCGSDWEQQELTKDLEREGISGVFVHKDAHTLFYVAEDIWEYFKNDTTYARKDIKTSLFDPNALFVDGSGAKFEQLYSAGSYVWMKYRVSLGPDQTALYFVLIEDAVRYQFMFYTYPDWEIELYGLIPDILKSFDINGQLVKNTTTTTTKATTTQATSVYLAPLVPDETSESSDIGTNNANFDFWAIFTPLNIVIATAVLWVIRVLWGMYLGRFWDNSPENAIRTAVEIYKDCGWELPRRLLLCLGLAVIATKWLPWVIWLPFVYLCIVAIVGTVSSISVIISNITSGNMRLNMYKLAVGSEVFHILSLLQVYILLLYMIKEIWL